MNNLITLMIVAPLVGTLGQVLIPGKGNAGMARAVAFLSSLFSAVCGLVLIFSIQTATHELQAVEKFAWVGSFSISYNVAVDGLNSLLVLLISIVFPVLIVAEWSGKKGIRGMHGLFLLLQSSMIGVVCSQNLFLIFFFWAISVLPIYFLLAIWGDEEREQAAFRYIINSSIGNAILFGMLVLVYYSVEPHTFAVQELLGGKIEPVMVTVFGHTVSIGSIAFVLLGFGVAFRVPVWPFHGWFTSVARQAPASAFVALCAVTVPVAIYVFTRIAYSLFPGEMSRLSDLVMILGGLNIVFGALCAISQKELRLFLAFVCMAQVGFLLVGIGSLDSAGVVGVVYQQLAVGLGIAGFGLFLGLIRERTGKSVFLDGDGNTILGGVASKAPFLALLTGVLLASLLGIPGLGGFVGQSLIMMGGYAVHPSAILVIALGAIIMTYGLFSVYRHVFLGQAQSSSLLGKFGDLSLRERGYFFPIVAALLFLGVYPKPLLDLVRTSILSMLSTIR